MKYQVEENIHNFPFWSGAKDTIAELTIGEMNSLEQLIEDIFCDELPTDTEINDFVWFDRDTIAQHLGYDDFDHLMRRNNLPSEVFIEYDKLDVDWEECDEDELLDAISDYLSDEYGYCHDGFEYKNTGSCICVTNIEWDTTD
jgi:hypothetical protein